MSRIISILVLSALVVLSASAIALAGDEAAKDKKVTLSGEIVEAGCYLERGQRAAENPACIKRCAASGMPMALLTGDSSLYLILKHHENTEAYEKAKGLAAERVEITGVVHERGGVRAIMVLSIKELDQAESKM
jgi:hypothetical protein